MLLEDHKQTLLTSVGGLRETYHSQLHLLYGDKSCGGEASPAYFTGVLQDYIKIISMISNHTNAKGTEAGQIGLF